MEEFLSGVPEGVFVFGIAFYIIKEVLSFASAQLTVYREKRNGGETSSAPGRSHRAEIEEIHSRVQNTERMTKDLFDMHDVKDRDGVYIWYVRPSFAEAITELTDVLRDLSYMTKEDAKREIRNRNYLNKLEHILAKQRYAQIVMDISYDNKDKAEEQIVIKKFKNALKENDMKQAVSIQDYIFDVSSDEWKEF